LHKRKEENTLAEFKIGDRVHNINFGYGTIRERTNKGYWLVDWDERLIRKITDVEYTDNGVDRKCRIFYYPCDCISKVSEKSKFKDEIINDVVSQIMRFLVRFGKVSVIGNLNAKKAFCEAEEILADKAYSLSWEIDDMNCTISVKTKIGEIEIVRLMKSDMTDEQKSILLIFNALVKRQLEEEKRKRDEECKRNRELLIERQMRKAGIII
jgi:hypothetical protein